MEPALSETIVNECVGGREGGRAQVTGAGTDLCRAARPTREGGER